MTLIIGYVRIPWHHTLHQTDDMDSLKALSSPSNVLFIFHLSAVCLFLIFLFLICLSVGSQLPPRTSNIDSNPDLFVTQLPPDVLVSAGVHYDSASEQYQVGVTARKNIQLGSSETWLKLSQDALYNPQTQKVHSQPCWHNMSAYFFSMC